MSEDFIGFLGARVISNCESLHMGAEIELVSSLRTVFALDTLNKCLFFDIFSIFHHIHSSQALRSFIKIN